MASIWLRRMTLTGFAIAVTGLSAGCLQQSLNPLFPLKDAVFDARLLGAWTCGNETWTFTRESDPDSSKEFYRIDVRSGGRTGQLAAWLGRINDDLFVTFVPDLEDEWPTPFFGRHLIGVFTFGRVTVEPTRLRLSMLGSAWAEHAHAAGQLTIGVNRGWEDGVDIILTAPPADLQRFARTYAHDDEVFSEEIELVRPAANSDGRCYAEK